MIDWNKTLVSPLISLREALKTLDLVGCKIVLVVDGNYRLLGTLSDGDIRRALLRGETLDLPVSEAMCKNPKLVYSHDDRGTRLRILKLSGLHQLPVVDKNGCVVGLEVINDYFKTDTREETVVIMAGGLGRRLGDLTHDAPKPMLRVGSRPILETIVRSLCEQGFSRVYLAVNYKADQIEAHFGDGSSFGIEVQYLREQKRMGTAGALSLLSSQQEHPILVTNADLLTNTDYGSMIDSHLLTRSAATIAVRRYEMQVPFGVIEEEGDQISTVVEKPTYHFLVSAGIYVFSPTVLDLVPRDQFFDMPMLFESIMEQGLSMRSYHIDGYWLDIGQPSDYEQANQDFQKVFR
jgi:dTDP-glucose pyrophosphorylase